MSFSSAGRTAAPWLGLLLLPIVIHIAPLAGWIDLDPAGLCSGLVISSVPGPASGLWFTDCDVGTQTQALGHLAAEVWLHGHLPWWNPYEGPGLPLAAVMQPSALFLPFVLLLQAPALGPLLLKIAMQMLAGAATYALLRRVGLCRFASGLDAAVYALNGCFAWFGHAPILPIPFLPVMLLGIENAWRDVPRAQAAGLLLTAAGIAGSLYAGFPETAFLDALFGAVWTLARLPDAARPLAFALRSAVAAVAGVLIAMPAVWPFVQLLTVGDLGNHGVPAPGGFPVAAYGISLFPTLFGLPFETDATFPDPRLTDVFGYLGGFGSLSLLALAILGALGRGRERRLRIVLAIFAVVWLARAGAAPGVTWLLSRIPLIDRTLFFRYATPGWLLALTVLAAFALDDWRRGLKQRPLLAGALSALAAVAALSAAWPLVASRLAVPAIGWRPVTSVAGSVVIAAVILLLIRRGRSPLRATGLAACVVIEAACLFAAPMLTAPRSQTLDLSAVDFLRAHLGLQRFYALGPLRPNYGAFWQVAQINHDYLPAPIGWLAHIRTQLDPLAHPVWFRGDEPPPAHVSALRDNLAAYEALGVRYVLARPGIAALPPENGAKIVHDGPAATVWELPSPAPYFEVVAGGPCSLVPSGRDHVHADCAAPATLLRREYAYPGWSARVNGAFAELVPHDDLFASIALHAGVSDVAFRYAPPWIGLAFGAAAAASLGLIVGAWGLLRSASRGSSAGTAAVRAPASRLP
jgi:hypothetical protein